MYHSRNHTGGLPRDLRYTDEIGDATDTDHYMELDAEANSEQLSPINVNPEQNMICAEILNLIAMTTTEFKLPICLGIVPGTTTSTICVSWKTATERLRSTYVHTHKTLSIISGTTPHS